jgi:hypothetical protein
MAKHYAEHGADMGYKSAVRYTAGALRAVRGAVNEHVLSNGNKALVTKDYRVVLKYGKKLASYMNSTAKGWRRWKRR